MFRRKLSTDILRGAKFRYYIRAFIPQQFSYFSLSSNEISTMVRPYIMPDKSTEGRYKRCRSEVRNYCSSKCTALVVKQTKTAMYDFLSTGLWIGPDLSNRGPAQSIPTRSNTSPGFTWSAKSWPNICGLGLAATFLHLTQLLTIDLMVLLPFKMLNRRDNDADTRVNPASNNCLCSDLVNNSVKPWFQGNRMGWRFVYGRSAWQILASTHKIPLVSKNGWKVRRLLVCRSIHIVLKSVMSSKNTKFWMVRNQNFSA